MVIVYAFVISKVRPSRYNQDINVCEDPSIWMEVLAEVMLWPVLCVLVYL
jgi:hypothetical protein